MAPGQSLFCACPTSRRDFLTARPSMLIMRSSPKELVERASSLRSLALHCPDRNHDFIIGIAIVDLVLPQFIRGKAVQHCRGGQYVTLRLYLDIASAKRFFEQKAKRQTGKPPVVAPPVHIVSADLADP